MQTLHFDLKVSQSSKRNNKVCGDVVEFTKTKKANTYIIADGLGSGIQANIAAKMCTARIKTLLESGFTVREAFQSVVKTMEEAKEKDTPYAVFTIARILNDGVATILSYEMPPPILISNKLASILPQRKYYLNNSLIGEVNCYIKLNEALLIVSDGITQAGLGKGLTEGWEIKGVERFLNNNSFSFDEIPDRIKDQAVNYWQGRAEDDLTVSLISARKGKIINLLTGPPANKENDKYVIDRFLAKPGLKIICGASTAKIAAREMNKDLVMEENYSSNITPINYEIEGISLVTEGVITLNQVYNIWDEDDSQLDKDSPVTVLYSLLNVADRVNLFVGKSKNPASDDISFRQMGILRRDKIIPLLAEKLEKDGKLVVIEEI